MADEKAPRPDKSGDEKAEHLMSDKAIHLPKDKALTPSGQKEHGE